MEQQTEVLVARTMIYSRAAAAATVAVAVVVVAALLVTSKSAVRDKMPRRIDD